MKSKWLNTVKRARFFFWGLGLFHFGLTVAMFMFPENILRLANAIPSRVEGLEPVSALSDYYWYTLTCAYSVTLGLLSIMTAQNLSSRGYGFILIFSKLVTVALSTFFFLQREKVFLYAVSAVWDGVFSIFCLWFWLRALYALRQIELEPTPSGPSEF